MPPLPTPWEAVEGEPPPIPKSSPKRSFALLPCCSGGGDVESLPRRDAVILAAVLSASPLHVEHEEKV